MIFSFIKFRCITKFVSSKNLRNFDKTNSSSIFLKQSKQLIKAELNKDNATSAETGFVNLLSVLLKLTNKTKIDKAVKRGIKGIRIVEFMRSPTKKFVSTIRFYIILMRYFIKQNFLKILNVISTYCILCKLIPKLYQYRRIKCQPFLKLLLQAPSFLELYIGKLNSYTPKPQQRNKFLKKAN